MQPEKRPNSVEEMYIGRDLHLDVVNAETAVTKNQPSAKKSNAVQ